MKKIILSIIFILASHAFIFSQISKNSYIISMEGQFINYEKEYPHNAYGIEIQYLLSDHFGINAHINVGRNYVHLPMGIAVVALSFAVLAQGGGSGCDASDCNGNGCDPSGCNSNGCSGNDFDSFCNNIGLPVLLILLSDGATFHFKANDQLTFSPYLNPLGFDYFFEKSKNALYVTFTSGLKCQYIINNKFIFAPFAEFRTNYITSQKGFACGATFGVLLH